MKRNVIRLDESKLRRIVAESVKRVLSEIEDNSQIKDKKYFIKNGLIKIDLPSEGEEAGATAYVTATFLANRKLALRLGGKWSTAVNKRYFDIYTSDGSILVIVDDPYLGPVQIRYTAEGRDMAYDANDEAIEEEDALEQLDNLIMRNFIYISGRAEELKAEEDEFFASKNSGEPIINEEMDERADKMGNGTPGFFQKTFNTKANRAYNFRQAVQNNPEYNAHIQANAKKAANRKNDVDYYGNDYVSDDFNTLKKQAGKGVYANKIAKDVYQQNFQKALQGEKDASAARRRAESDMEREKWSKRAEELKQSLRYEFTKSPVNWNRVQDLQGSLASAIGRDNAINYVSDLKKNHGYTGAYSL